MSYYIKKEIELDYPAAIERTKPTLKENGFGVITEIDMQATLKEKIGADIEPYIILGACNPNYANHALQKEELIGLMLPCNVVVKANANGGSTVAAVDPIEVMNPIDNEELGEMAAEVRENLEKAIEQL